jgi:hypothetical protein
MALRSHSPPYDAVHDDPFAECYAALDLAPGASLAEVRDAYRVLSRVWHPDRFAGDARMQERATARQQELNEAYQRLVVARRAGTASSVGGSGPAPTSGRRNDESDAYDGPADPAPEAAGSVAAARRPAAGQTVRSFSGRSGLVVLVASGLAAVAIVLASRSAGGIPVRDSGGVAVRASVLDAGAGACAGGEGSVWCWEPGARRGRAALAGPTLGVASGLLHSCALTAGSQVLCWGSNFAGQLGVGGVEDRANPAAIALTGPFTAVSTLGRHTCALSAGGAVYCWGDDTDGQLGVGTPVAACRLGDLRFFCSDRPERVQGRDGWLAVAAGGSHTCALDGEGRVHCWGSNRYGQLGGITSLTCDGPGGSVPCRREPGTVRDLGAGMRAVASGASHSCALDADGRAFCWGANNRGQAGAAPNASTTVRPVQTDLRFQHLSAGGAHTCGVTENGGLYCWGSDDRGELGGRAKSWCGDARCSFLPLRLASGIATAAAGFGLTCAVKRDRRMRCWGGGESPSPAMEPGARPTALQAPAWPGSEPARLLDEASRFVHRLILDPLGRIF